MNLTLQAEAASPLLIPLVDVLEDHVLSDYDLLAVENGSVVSEPAEELQLSLVEVDPADALGLYMIRLVPRVSGVLYLKLSRGFNVWQFFLQVSDAPFSDASLEGDYTVTLEDGLGPIPGATVRVFDTSGSRQVQRGVTDSNGKVTFYGLPVGSYQVRAYKDGVDFSGVNPTQVVVVPNDAEAPVLRDVIPRQGAPGDVLAITGRFFGGSPRVLFGAQGAVGADHVNEEGTLLLVTVPNLSDTLVPLRVDKEDPTTPPDRLTSNSLLWQKV